MSYRSSSAILLASALCCASACEGGKPPAKKTEASEPEPSKPEASRPEPSRTPAVVVESEGEPPRPAAPAWFDAEKIEHAAVVNQIASKGKIAGGQASALILELKPGVTDEQCVAMAREAIAATVPDVPEATPGEGDRLMLQGKTDSYHYTVVCGQANGKPTMYLSYTTQ